MTSRWDNKSPKMYGNVRSTTFKLATIFQSYHASGTLEEPAG